MQNVWNGRLRGLLPVRSGNGSPSRRLRQHLPDRRYAVQRRTSVRQFAVDGNTLLLLVGTNALFTRDTLILNVFCLSIVNCSVVFTGHVAWFWKRHFGSTDGRMRQRLKQTSIPFPPSLTNNQVKHEILHALGFSAGLFAFYRDDDGLPLTPRLQVDNKPFYNETLRLLV